jgi:Tol biopolymer transport system component
MASGGTGVWILPMRGDRTPRRLAASKAVQGSGRFSPDGKWVAYCANEGDGNQVYVQPWPGPGPKVQVSSEGGTDPVWSPKGGELFYRHGDKMMVVDVATQPAFRASKPRTLWEGHYAHGMSSSCGPPGTSEGSYDFSPDGQRFLMIKDADEDYTSTRIVVVLNFAEELKALFKARQ